MLATTSVYLYIGFLKASQHSAVHLQERIEQLALKLQPVHVTTILWAYARLELHPGIELMEALLSSVATGVHTFDPQVSQPPFQYHMAHVLVSMP